MFPVLFHLGFSGDAISYHHNGYVKSYERILPGSDWDVHRFRPNIAIETSGDKQGLLEQGWIGKAMKISNTHIECTAPRCGAITRAQNKLPFDKSMLRTVINAADQNLGIYGNITQQGILSVGDSVYID